MPEQPHPRAGVPDLDVLELDELENVTGGSDPVDETTNKCQGNIAPTCGVANL